MTSRAAAPPDSVRAGTQDCRPRRCISPKTCPWFDAIRAASAETSPPAGTPLHDNRGRQRVNDHDLKRRPAIRVVELQRPKFGMGTRVRLVGLRQTVLRLEAREMRHQTFGLRCGGHARPHCPVGAQRPEGQLLLPLKLIFEEKSLRFIPAVFLNQGGALIGFRLPGCGFLGPAGFGRHPRQGFGMAHQHTIGLQRHAGAHVAGIDRREIQRLRLGCQFRPQPHGTQAEVVEITPAQRRIRKIAVGCQTDGRLMMIGAPIVKVLALEHGIGARQQIAIRLVSVV